VGRGPPFLVGRGARICGPDDGLYLGIRQVVDQTELVSEWILHHSPVDDRWLVTMRPRPRVQARRLLHRSSQGNYPGDGLVDALVRSHVDVNAVGILSFAAFDHLQDELVPPGVLAS